MNSKTDDQPQAVVGQPTKTADNLLADLLPHRGKVFYPWGGPPPGLDVMWRAEAKRYSVVIDYETDHYGSSDPVIEMHWYEVRKRTRCGARLANGRFTYTDKRITAREWASNTPAEALASFRERRRHQVGILSRQLRCAQIELALTDGAEAGEPPAYRPTDLHVW
mgnify:FL=1